MAALTPSCWLGPHTMCHRVVGRWANGCSTLPKTWLTPARLTREGTCSVLVTGCGSPPQDMILLFLVGETPPLKSPLMVSHRGIGGIGSSGPGHLAPQPSPETQGIPLLREGKYRQRGACVCCSHERAPPKNSIWTRTWLSQ